MIEYCLTANIEMLFKNISVGRSEDNDVGALENIIGNALVTGTD